MTGAPPPPLPAGPPPPRRADPASGPWPGVAAAGAARARTFAAWAIGATVFAASCCGGAAWFGAARMDRKVRVKEAALAARETVEAQRREAAAVLDAVASRLLSEPGDLPPILPEAPPRDPWGNPVRYVRSRPDRAALTSAGPDGRLDTRDDVERTVARD